MTCMYNIHHTSIFFWRQCACRKPTKQPGWTVTSALWELAKSHLFSARLVWFPYRLVFCFSILGGTGFSWVSLQNHQKRGTLKQGSPASQLNLWVIRLEVDPSLRHLADDLRRHFAAGRGAAVARAGVSAPQPSFLFFYFSRGEGGVQRGPAPKEDGETSFSFFLGGSKGSWTPPWSTVTVTPIFLKPDFCVLGGGGSSYKGRWIPPSQLG